jgi:hypothetical protein
MFLILYRKKNNNIYKSSTGLCNVCVVHYFHPRCAWLFFLSTFWSVTLPNIEQHPLSVTLKNFKLALLVGKKKRIRKCWSFLCVFFNLFRERKLIKVVFSMFPLFLFLPGSCESGGERNFYFHCFLLYIVNGGDREKGFIGIFTLH